MKIKLLLICFLLSFFFGESHAEVCPDLTKIRPLLKQLALQKVQPRCPLYLKKGAIDWLTQTALPQLMNKEFLGVEPPPNWQFSTQLLLNTCYQSKNLCQEETQQELLRCFASNLPLLLVQYGDWLSNQCDEVQRSFLKHWPEKKRILIKLIADFYQLMSNKTS